MDFDPIGAVSIPEKKGARITQESLRNAYDYLASVPPCSRWQLPSSTSVRFKISKARMTCGMYEPDPHTITVSKVTNSTQTDVLMTLAHEVVHLHAERNGLGGHEEHDKQFWKYAAQVCDAFGWKLEDF